MTLKRNSTGRAIVELLDRRKERQDYQATFLLVVFVIGFLFGLLIGAILLQPDERFYDIRPMPDSFRYERTRVSQ